MPEVLMPKVRASWQSLVRWYLVSAYRFLLRGLWAVVLSLSLLGSAATITGCVGTAVTPTESQETRPEPLTFQDLLELEVRAFARRQELGARRTAHFMSQTVTDSSSGGAILLDHPSAPEGYTFDGQPASMPWQYHIGYAAHRLIVEHYRATHPKNLVFDDFTSIRMIVDDVDGNLGFLNTYEEGLRPDIADASARFVFEIKPPGAEHLADGKSKIDQHLRSINKAMVGVPLFKPGMGYRGELGVRFAEDEGVPAWKLEWDTTAPGILQFRWRRLNTEDDDVDDYREAYEKARWRDLTPQEMVRYARPLQEAVESLVRARERMGPGRAATSMPVVLAGTSADFTRSMELWSREDKVPWLLPVVRKPPAVAQARRDARLVAQTVGGGSSGGGNVPEGYTIDGRPGNQPWNFHMGNAAHLVIGTHYQKVLHVGKDVRINTVSISTIVTAAGGKPALLLPGEALMRPDITNIFDHVVFQIKSSTKGQLQEGQVAQDLAAINRTMPPRLFTPGVDYAGDLAVRLGRGKDTYRITWTTTAPGVVQYRWTKLDRNDPYVGKIEQAMKAGKWVDLTEADMQADAEKILEKAEDWAKRANLFDVVQEVTGFVIQVLGDATLIFVSPGLGPGKKLQPAASPKARPSLPPVQPLPPSQPSRGPTKIPSRPPELPRPPSGVRIGDSL
jgi:hypothetical protein